MSEEKWPEGPWEVVPYGDGDSLVIHTDKDSRICFMAKPGEHGDPEAIKAAAHLIEEAPSLYEALKEQQEHFCEQYCLGSYITEPTEHTEECEEMQAVLARARGESGDDQ